MSLRCLIYLAIIHTVRLVPDATSVWHNPETFDIYEVRPLPWSPLSAGNGKILA